MPKKPVKKEPPKPLSEIEGGFSGKYIPAPLVDPKVVKFVDGKGRIDGRDGVEIHITATDPNGEMSVNISPRSQSADPVPYIVRMKRFLSFIARNKNALKRFAKLADRTHKEFAVKHAEYKAKTAPKVKKKKKGKHANKAK